MSGVPPPGRLDAVLFDMDGLLVDTEPQWLRAETAVVGALGGQWGPQHQQALLGTNLELAAQYMVDHCASDRPVAEVMAMLEEAMTDQLRSGVALRPGAASLVAELHEASVPLAIVTSSVRAHLEVVLPHLPDAFRFAVTADDVSRLKPHPEPYLQALSRIGARAERTVVLEDSPTGVTAGEAAGCVVVAVPSVVEVPARAGRTVVTSLAAVDHQTLIDLVRTSAGAAGKPFDASRPRLRAVQPHRK